MGATVASEQTAAAEGAVGTLRRDPFAMLPFCGYNMADYWSHWLAMGRLIEDLPNIYQVNWFRKGKDGQFLWPGFGDNSRVLAWIVQRLEGLADASYTPVGSIPTSLDTEGLDIDSAVLTQLFEIDPSTWRTEVELTQEYFAQFGDRTPMSLWYQLDLLKDRLG